MHIPGSPVPIPHSTPACTRTKQPIIPCATCNHSRYSSSEKSALVSSALAYLICTCLQSCMSWYEISTGLLLHTLHLHMYPYTWMYATVEVRYLHVVTVMYVMIHLTSYINAGTSVLLWLMLLLFFRKKQSSSFTGSSMCPQPTWNIVQMYPLDCMYYCSDMGWLRLVDSLKLQDASAKEPYKRDDILQKRPIILRSLLIIVTP